jgi:disulfide bond formation protein DsbB
MPAVPSKSCEDPDYPIPVVPLTMAQMNLLYALVVAAGLGFATRRARS